MAWRVIVHAVDGSASDSVLAVHVLKAADNGALLPHEQVPLPAEHRGALATEVREASVLESLVRRVQLVLGRDGLSRAPGHKRAAQQLPGRGLRHP
eukprot:15475526-Alexandrium_andersonii.AAC.1